MWGVINDKNNTKKDYIRIFTLAFRDIYCNGWIFINNGKRFWNIRKRHALDFGIHRPCRNRQCRHVNCNVQIFGSESGQLQIPCPLWNRVHHHYSFDFPDHVHAVASGRRIRQHQLPDTFECGFAVHVHSVDFGWIHFVQSAPFDAYQSSLISKNHFMYTKNKRSALPVFFFRFLQFFYVNASEYKFKL